MKLAPVAAVLSGALSAASAVAAPAPAYILAKTTPIGAPDKWDYVVASPELGRVFVAHGDRVAVLDAASGAVVGEILGIPGGTHGVAVSTATGQGFTDDGKSGKAVAFDLKTLKVTKTIAAEDDADGIAIDKVTGHVFVVEGDPAKVGVIDPKTDAPATQIAAGEKLEYIAADGHGSVFAAGEEKRDLVRIDARTNTVTAHWATPDCESPHGLTLDVAGHRAFMSCVNTLMMVVDTETGRLVAKLPIGRGSDAVAFDPVRKRAFSSDGADGVISVYQAVSPDRYVALEPIKTQVSARTMDVDPRSGRLFVVAADTDPPAQPGKRPVPRAGTLKVLMFDPVTK